MIRLHTLFWLIVVAATGFAMFAVKYQVQELADQLTQTVKQADDVERGNRVLDAEWAYLNRPDALAQMNQRFLSLAPIATKQLRPGISEIAMRSPPPAPVETAAPTPGAPATPPPTDDTPAPAGSVANAPPLVRPTEGTAAAVVAAAFDQARLSRPAKPPTAIKAPFRSAPPRRAASLDELIAQVTESR